jgi:hypothetical protein
LLHRLGASSSLAGIKRRGRLAFPIQYRSVDVPLHLPEPRHSRVRFDAGRASVRVKSWLLEPEMAELPVDDPRQNVANPDRPDINAGREAASGQDEVPAAGRTVMTAPS